MTKKTVHQAATKKEKKHIRAYPYAEGNGVFSFGNAGRKLMLMSRPCMILLLVCTTVALLGGVLSLVTASVWYVASFAVPYAMYAIGQTSEDTRAMRAYLEASAIVGGMPVKQQNTEEKGKKIKKG